ncbi:MAG: transporter related protein [Acidobacteriales bacterium]|nr:transporter related protein [Terriglobales bacterium]
MPLLQLSGIKKRFGATVALNGVSLAVEPGEVHALIGENGAGKSTLMNILSGGFPADSGEMHFSESPYAPAGPSDARSRGIAHIHQELSLCPHLSVAENILLGMEPSRYGVIDRAAMSTRARQLLNEFGCDHIVPEQIVASLSVPDQQVVEICRALASNARIILMDEPTSSLTQHSVQRLFRVIRQLRDQGVAIIYISHFLEEVREIADRYTVLRDGASVDTGSISPVSDSNLVAAMVGREVESIFTHHASPTHSGTDTPILEVRNLSFPPRLASASFDLYRGEVLGIGGLVGSGRTEMVRALFGLARASGTVKLSGREIRVSNVSSSEQIQNNFGYLSEDRKGEGLCLQMSIADNLTISRMSDFSRAGWIDAAKQKNASAKIIATLGIKTKSADTPALRLSGGNQQKVALGRLLHQNPDILLLDEPTRGVDIRSKSDIYKEIRALAAEGKAILMVSSYLPELLGICDRIAVMSRGRLSPARAVVSWTPQSIMEAAIGDAAPQQNAG